MKSEKKDKQRKEEEKAAEKVFKNVPLQFG
jgi:hypothetical protein